jgi:hypothetical protein
MALSAVTPMAALDSDVRSWVIHWVNKGAPESSASICGEIAQCEVPTFAQVEAYLPNSATEGKIFCVPCEDGGVTSRTVPPTIYPVARRAEKPAAAPAAPAAQSLDMAGLAAILSRSIADGLAPLQQRIDQLEQRNAALNQPVVSAMGMGMDPSMKSLLDSLIAKSLAPPPPNPFQEKLMEIALASLTQPREKDELGAMVNHITKLRLGKELARELRDQDDGDKDGDSDEKTGEEFSVMDAIKVAGQMMRPQQAQEPQQAQASPRNIFDSPSDLQAQIMSDPEKAAQAMRQLGRQYPEVAAIARRAMREGEKEAGSTGGQS